MFKFGVSALFAAIAAAKYKDGSEFNGPEYIALSRKDKSDKMWGKVIENTKSGSTHMAGALVVDQAPVFDTEGDELPCYWNGCRNKTIHSIGTVAKIKWVSKGSHAYTGMFKGSDAGFARLSVAKPTDTKTPNMAPGMGVKLLRDGYDSADFVCMFSVDGQEDLNWFANDFSNHIPDPQTLALKPLFARFANQSDYIQTVGLSEMASFTQDGKEEARPNFPWLLRFQPTGQYEFPSSVAAGYTDFRNDLMTITSGSTLYDVYATDKPTELGGKETKIASIVTASEMTTSYWGDEHMYIRHERMEEDLKIHPEWEQYTPKYGGIFSLAQEDSCSAENMFSLEQQESGSGCPFANILQYLQ